MRLRLLSKDGYKRQHRRKMAPPLRRCRCDKRILAQQDGPCILVALALGSPVLPKPEPFRRLPVLSTLRPHMPDAWRDELTIENVSN